MGKNPGRVPSFIPICLFLGVVGKIGIIFPITTVKVSLIASFPGRVDWFLAHCSLSRRVFCQSHIDGVPVDDDPCTSGVFRDGAEIRIINAAGQPIGQDGRIALGDVEGEGDFTLRHLR